MPTAQTIINKSLRQLGVIASGDAPTPEEYNDSLEALNSIIETWQTDDRAYYSQNDSTFAITTSTGQYAIGDATLTISGITRSGSVATATTTTRHSFETGNKVTVAGCVETDYNVTAAVTVISPTVFTYAVANTPTSPATTLTSITGINANFNIARPVELLGAFIRASNVDYPIGIITERKWDAISAKATTAAQPTSMLYRPAYPFGQLLMYPIPTTAGTLHVKTRNMLQAYSSLTQDQPMPPGYYRALNLALSIDVAPEYGAKVQQESLLAVTNAFRSLWDLNTMKPASSKDNLKVKASLAPQGQVQQ